MGENRALKAQMNFPNPLTSKTAPFSSRVYSNASFPTLVRNRSFSFEDAAGSEGPG